MDLNRISVISTDLKKIDHDRNSFVNVQHIRKYEKV